MTRRARPAQNNGYLSEHARLLAHSHYALTGRPLLAGTYSDQDLGKALYEAPFALVSHDVEADPIFNYANLTAQHLFELDWPDFIQLPSRHSAEAPNRQARAELLARVEQHGFIQDYTGVRISAQGRRFRIERACVWNLTDEAGRYCGQAACFAHWSPLGEGGRQNHRTRLGRARE